MKPHPTKSKPRKGARALVLRGILIDHVKIDMDTRYLILPLSPDARERRVDAIAKALATYAYSTRVEDYRGEARAVLASLGDTPAEGRGK